MQAVIRFRSMAMLQELYNNTCFTMKRAIRSDLMALSLSKKSSESWAFCHIYGIMYKVMTMLEKNTQSREQVEIICLEDLVPQDHLLRKIDRAVDFNKIYEFVEELYCLDNGRPSIDPVILFKMVLIQHLYGIRSLRRVAEESSMNVAYRWFLGYSLNDTTPHFSTLSYNSQSFQQ